MKIGSCRSINAFTIGDWKKLANRTGLGWPVVRERMGEICRSVLDEIDDVCVRIKKVGEAAIVSLNSVIRERTDKMLEALSGQEG